MKTIFQIKNVEQELLRLTSELLFESQEECGIFYLHCPELIQYCPKPRAV